jgi:hypothetical protein
MFLMIVVVVCKLGVMSEVLLVVQSSLMNIDLLIHKFLLFLRMYKLLGSIPMLKAVQVAV